MELKKGKKWYKSFSNWLVILAVIILLPILVMNIYIMIQSKTNKEKVPSVFGYKPFIVLSGSMEGYIKKGDLIITKTIDTSKLEIKDVIAFRDSNNTVTTHRIIDIIDKNGTKQYITKGDNSSTQDQNLVNPEDVEGIYVMRIPGLGSIMDSLAKPTTVLILCLIITMVFAIGFMISMQKDKKLEREEFLEYKMMKEKEKNNSKYSDLSKEELLDLLNSRKKDDE